MIRKIVGTVVFGPFAIALFLVIAGVAAALIGGLAGWENFKISGGAVASLGVIGFVSWLFLMGVFPIAHILDSPPGTNSKKPAQPNVAEAGQKETK
jgi:hypothetical protein